MSAGVVIAGGGLAAQRCAEALRRGGHAAPIRIVSAETVPPYDRPPLSKAFLAGQVDADGVALRPPGWHDEQSVDLLLGDAAAGLDTARRRLRLASGAEVPYEHLVIATGSRARRLPGAAGLRNVHTLRTLDDARRLSEALRPGARLVVLGAGLIGQEVAATAQRRGTSVALVEAESVPLARALHPELAQWLVRLQREQGVDVRLGAPVVELVRDGDMLKALVLRDGSRIGLDLMLVAIGVRPNDDWLPAAAAELTRRPEIFVAGDVAGGDHWEAAVHSGRAAAHAILGVDRRPSPMTSWWSDVHGVRLQGLGSPVGADDLTYDGDPAGRVFTALAHRHGQPIAALAVGCPQELPRLRSLFTPSTIPSKEAA